MAYKIVAIFVILVSWSTLLYASSLGCDGGQNVPRDQYAGLMDQIRRRVSQQFTEDNITCLKVVSGFGSQQYCVILTIGNTTCTVKFGNGRGSESSSICSTNGSNVVNGRGSNGITIGGSGNPEVKNAMRAMKERLSHMFRPGFPFNK